MSDHAPPPVPMGTGVTGGPESVRDGSEAENEFDQLGHGIMCVGYVTIIPMSRYREIVQL